MGISEVKKVPAGKMGFGIEMLAASIVMMLSNAGMALYLRILAVFTKASRLGLPGSFKKLHLNKKSGRRLALRSTGIRRRKARTIVELKSNTTFHHAERTTV
jgi:hypothetical protein